MPVWHLQSKHHVCIITTNIASVILVVPQPEICNVELSLIGHLVYQYIGRKYRDILINIDILVYRYIGNLLKHV